MERRAISIVHDDDILGGEPRVEGTRVRVRHIATRVIDAGQSPAYVADQLDLTIADVYEAMAHYRNIEEIRQFERENEAAFEHFGETSVKLKEPAS